MEAHAAVGRDGFLGAWEWRRIETLWNETKPKELINRLVVKKGTTPDTVAIEYVTDGLGICEVQGIAKVQEDSIKFSSWNPLENKKANSLIVQDKMPCTLDITLTTNDKVTVGNVSRGCAEACGVHGGLEAELLRTR